MWMKLTARREGELTCRHIRHLRTFQVFVRWLRRLCGSYVVAPAPLMTEQITAKEEEELVEEDKKIWEERREEARRHERVR